MGSGRSRAREKTGRRPLAQRGGRHIHTETTGTTQVVYLHISVQHERDNGRVVFF